MKNRISIFITAIQIAFLFFIGFSFYFHIKETDKFNETVKTVSNFDPKGTCVFDIHFRGGASDSWDKPYVDENGEDKMLVGVTYDGSFYNYSEYEVSDWSLKIYITSDCFINRAWCGTMEIHQEKNGQGYVQELDLRQCKTRDIKLDFIELGNDILIPLKKGDVLIYHPTASVNEFPISAFKDAAGSVTMGFILYSLKSNPAKITNYAIQYKLKKSYLDGSKPKIFVFMIITWFLILIIRITVKIAYKTAENAAEKKVALDRMQELERFNKEIQETNKQLEESNAVIKAVSEIYFILYKVDLEKDTFIEIRTNERLSKFASKFKSAKEALNAIPNAMFIVDDSVKDFYDCSNWNKYLSDKDTFCNECVSKYSGWVRSSIIAAKRDADGNPIHVLVALQDVDKMVREEQELKKELSEALAVAEVANKFLQTYNKNLNVEVEKKTGHIKEIQEKIVLGLANVIEDRDVDTGGHVKRTSDIIKFLVSELQKQYPKVMTKQRADDIVRSAPMHDLGKIYINTSILCKPGKLTPEEYDVMKTHSEKSRDIVKIILDEVEEPHFVKIAMNVALHHHERWDGNGYPSKLKGNEIPLEARIMSIADVYDALVSKRCYKQPFSFEKAFEIMCEGMGSQFDPKMKPIFIACREKFEEYYTNNK